jgi:hypothetical protein
MELQDEQFSAPEDGNGHAVDSDLFNHLQDIDLEDGIVDDIENEVRSGLSDGAAPDQRRDTEDLLDWFQMADSLLETADESVEYFFGEKPSKEKRKNNAILLGRLAQRRFPPELVNNKLEFAVLMGLLGAYGPIIMRNSKRNNSNNQDEE